MKVKVLAAAILLATPAIAESQLERFEVLAGELNTVMLDMMVNEIESQGGDGAALRALDGMFPPWSDEIRAAAGCILDAYVDETSADAVDTMLDDMTAMLPTLTTMTMTEATDNGTLNAMLPVGISEDRSLDINRECGMMELQVAASRESGFFEAMMEAGATVPDNN